jgi:hypothetical protein
MLKFFKLLPLFIAQILVHRAYGQINTNIRQIIIVSYLNT